MKKPTFIDSTAIDQSIAALARILRPEPTARVMIDVPLRELKYTPDGDNFPLVKWYGFDVEVCDSDYQLVSDHYAEWLRGER